MKLQGNAEEWKGKASCRGGVRECEGRDLMYERENEGRCRRGGEGEKEEEKERK